MANTVRPLLTYCGNVHPAADVDAWVAALDATSQPVARAARAAGRSFGLGAWWPRPVAQSLAEDPRALDRVRQALLDRDLVPWTLNVFPVEDFHAPVVKTAVYAPDWGTEERLLYTRHCAEAAAALVASGGAPADALRQPRGGSGPWILPMSTLPLGYRAPGDAPPDLRRMARNLGRAASMLADLEARTGVCCVLALEPEPFCLLETCAAAADFLERWLFAPGAWPTVGERILRRHLGVCVDLCHLFVVGEDPVAAIADLHRRGIAVPKVQVSSCLEVRSPAGLDRLLQFDEPRYLHQTVAGDGARALDLGEVRAQRPRFAVPPVRTHYHMPLYWDEAGAFGATRRELERVLPELRRLSPLPLFEVETYTWNVLPAGLRDRPLPDLLAAELAFAANLLGA